MGYLRHLGITTARPAFNPAHVSGLVGWWNDNSNNVALAQPTVASPKDLSSGSWTRTGLASVTHGQSDPDGGTSADLLTEDGSVGAHWITQSMGSVVTGIPIRARVRVKAGTSGSRGVVLNPSGGNAYINLSTGAVTSQIGLTSVTVTAQSDGWWLVDLVVTSCAGATMLIGLAQLPGTASYAGDGTSNARAYFIEATQNRVSQWSDISGSGNHVVQATAANQPVWTANDTTHMNGHPQIQTDGSNDVLATSGNLVVTAHTLVWAGRLIGSAADAGLCGSGTAGYAMTLDSATTLKYYCGAAEVASYAQGQNETVILTGRWTGDTAANGQQLYKNGSLQNQRTHSGAALTASTFKVGRATNSTNSKHFQAALYNRALTDDERTRVERYFGQQIGITI